MKRDMDLVRRIALATADLPAGGHLSQLNDVDQPTFNIHVEWMVEANLVKAILYPIDGQMGGIIQRLTWEGCEFADSVRNDTLWKAAKEKVLIPSASWSFGLLREWLAEELKNGFPTLGR